jgi:hypothetical protein
MENSKFGEIRTDYSDPKGVIHLDAWRTANENEEGEIIGFFINGEIYYRDPEYQFDPYVKEVVAELKAEDKAKKQELVDRVLEEIKRDVAAGDVTAIDELLKFCPKQFLIGYLPEEEWEKFEGKNRYS